MFFNSIILFCYLDAPSAPSGPMVVKDLKKDSLTIEWKAPIDDGGLQISKYSIEKCDPQKGVWMKVADVDRDIESYSIQKLLNNAQYLFRVTASNPIGESEPLESEAISIKKAIGKFIFIIFLNSKLNQFCIKKKS